MKDKTIYLKTCADCQMVYGCNDGVMPESKCDTYCYDKEHCPTRRELPQAGVTYKKTHGFCAEHFEIRMAEVRSYVPMFVPC